MANWISHIMIADRLLKMGLSLDAQGLCIGSIAPDCNIENETWTSFTPPREVTHFMTGDSKLTADHEGFFARHIAGKAFESETQRAYLIGYYAHLFTDAACQRFIRDEQRVIASYARILQAPALAEKVRGLPETFDTLKQVFGKLTVWGDIAAYEQRYILAHPDSMYNRILRRTKDFPDYLGILPVGAISRKIPRMAYEVTDAKETGMRFFSEQEIDEFITDTANSIFHSVCEKEP